MWLLYQIALGAVVLLVGPWLWLRRPRRTARTLAARWFGAAPATGSGGGAPPLWLHAVSVGEVGVAATFARTLPEELPLLVTTITATGQERARALLGARAEITNLPLDFGWPVRRFLARYQPRALVLVEGDYWPLLLRHVARRGLPVALVSGRISDRSYARLIRLRRFVSPLFRPVLRFGVQGERDRERLLALGVPSERVTVTGNLKFEGAATPPDPELRDALLRVAAGRPILVAGSTMPGEEEQVAAAQRIVGRDRALWLIAPRHPERFGPVFEVLRGLGLEVARRSQLAPANARCDAVLLDSLGELASLYALARGAFVGGTLVGTGGHNPLEPARCAIAIAVGPSMHNFQDIADEFDRAQAWQRVPDAPALARVCLRWCTDPLEATRLGQRAAGLLAAHRGASARTLALLRPFLNLRPAA